MDLKAKAEIPRCTSGSGGAVAAGVVVVLRVVANLVLGVRIHASTHSISNLEAKYACAVRKRSGKFTVVPAGLAVALAVVVVEIAIGVGVGVLMGG